MTADHKDDTGGLKDDASLQPKTRVQVRKWKAGSNLDGPPDEVVEAKDEGFDELVEELKRKEQDNAAA